jgi:hypothetical protein
MDTDIFYVKGAWPLTGVNEENCVKKGEPYYWWKIKTSGCDKIYPPITNSPFLHSAYSLQGDINSVSSAENSEELQSLRDGWIDDINAIAEDCQASLDAMLEDV